MLGWLNFDLWCCTILPSCSANFPSAHSEPGRGWNSQNQSQPNPTIRADGPPCSNWHYNLWFGPAFILGAFFEHSVWDKVWICGIRPLGGANTKVAIFSVLSGEGIFAGKLKNRRRNGRNGPIDGWRQGQWIRADLQKCHLVITKYSKENYWQHYPSLTKCSKDQIRADPSSPTVILLSIESSDCHFIIHWPA